MKKTNLISLCSLMAAFASASADAAQIRCFLPNNAKQVLVSVLDDHGSITGASFRGPTGNCEIDERNELTYDYYYGKHLVIRGARCPRGLNGNLVATAVRTQQGTTQYVGHLFFKATNSYDVKSLDVVCAE